MANWNGAPLPEFDFSKIPDSLPKNFMWEEFLTDPKGTFGKFREPREVHRMNWKGYRTAAASTKKIVASSPSRKFIAEAGKQIRALKATSEKTTKVANNGKKLWDSFLKKAPGGATVGGAASSLSRNN